VKFFILWQVIAHFYTLKKFIILDDTLSGINIIAKGNFLFWLLAIGSTLVLATL
jgi:hypothetical protein